MENINLADEIKKLIELQDIDFEIYKIRTDLEEMPGRIAAYDEIIKDKEHIFKDSEEKLKKVELERKQKEMDLKTKEDQIKKQQGQLFQIKTNKEYAALEKEIGSAKADNSILEEEILKLFDKYHKGFQRRKYEKIRTCFKEIYGRYWLGSCQGIR